MATMTRAQRREPNATHRRLRTDRERLEPEPRRAPRFLQALEQALVDVGLPETMVAEVEWRLQAHVTRLGNIFGLMCPPVCGCRTVSELAQVRVWDQNYPGRILGARPKQQWLQPLPRRGQARLIRLWQQVADKRPATQSRWPWTWAADDRVFKKSGQPLGLVGTWDSGQEHRVRLGSDGLLLVGVMGDGTLVVPVDFVVRRPDPVGPGRAKLTWWRVLRDRRWASLQRRCRGRPPPVVGADRWCGDAAVLGPVHAHQPGALVVEGQRRDVVARPDGRLVTGADRRTPSDWPWRNSPQGRGRRSARLTAIRATSGRVTRVLVDTPGDARFSWLCPATTLSAPRLLRAWSRRRWIAQTFRTLTHLWAAEACQVQTEDAYSGPLVWRLWAGLVRLYTARFRVQGRVTMEEMVCSLTHYWRFLTSEPLEFYALSWDLDLETA